MPINVQGKPTSVFSPTGTQNVSVVAWDTTNVIPLVRISGTAQVVLMAGTATQNVAIIGQPIGVSGTVSAAFAGTADVQVVNTPTVTAVPSGTQNVLLVGSIPAGNVLVGSFTSIPSGTQAVTGTVNGVLIASVPAGNVIIGSVNVVGIATTADVFAIPHGSSIRYAGVSTAVNFARINLVTSGDGIIVTSAAGKSVVVLSLVLNGNGANTAIIVSSASANPIGPTVFIATSGVGMVLNNNDHGWFRTTTGHSLVINVASSGSVSGCLTYLLSTTG